MEEIFDIEKFNVISDEENYYFLRSLEPGDIEDLEKNIIKDGEKYKRLRTDRERWEEKHKEEPRWNADSTVTLEEMFNHIKMHYSLQTNCISLSSNANVARTYGETFSDKYVMIKVPKKEMGEKVFHAGQYMLEEIEKKVERRISEGQIPENVLNDLQEIENAKTSKEIKEIIKVRYRTPQKLDEDKAHPTKGITYKSPYARISSWQSLDDEQTLEKNKIIAKLTVLEHKKLMNPLIPNSSNNNLLIQTVGSAFASSEQIYYGDIEGDRITDVPKEIVDMFGLLQQVEGQDKQIIDELKKELIQFINDGKKIQISGDSILKDETQVRDDISIEEMYDMTDGKVEYGSANSIVKNLFYLAKGQASARALANELRKITNNNPKYENVIKYIEDNGFEIEPKITTKLSNRGYKLSEAVNLNLKSNEKELVEQIKNLSNEDQLEIIQDRGLSNVNGLMSNNFSKVKKEEKISKERYYAEAIFSMYNWKKIGVEEFSVSERENIIQRIQEEHCIEVYQMLEKQGVNKKDISRVLLNIVTRGRDFEIEEKDTTESIKEKRLKQYEKIIRENKEELNEELSIERVERFLGYYDVPNTGIKLRPYQQKTVDNTDKILEDNRYASVILPTGGGKSFVALDQLMKHKDEKMLYLAPQNEILEQMKNNIIKYIHGPVNTLGKISKQKTKEELIVEVFPNLKFATYPSLLSKDASDALKEEYGFIVLDELHRTGASEWGNKLNELLDNQPETTRVLGITATPRRDSDGKNMSNEMAERLGYTNQEAVKGKHVAMDLSLTNAIRLGLVVHPKLVSCAYTLKTDGSLTRLKEEIGKIEDIEEKNERLDEYEKFRRNLENAEGIPEILQANVKKGGKYIVFLPMIENLEDEDGNVIGRKKGKDRIKEYEKQIAEYFKGSDITPNFHAMLGEYGDKVNERKLEEFQSRNTDDTEFLLVVNKANEGLHLDKLDGMIWLRAMDENSRILYLQQLGRVIYSEDKDNPTKDEKRPVVIDLVNNTLKVNWENKVDEKDDIELMNIITDWIEKHDGMLPNINSSDKEEFGYARVLKEIQSKYKKYLNNNFEDLSDEKINEIQEILRYGSAVDLWQSELPNRKVRKGEKNNENDTRVDYEEFFEITGILHDFVELEEKVEDNKIKHTYEDVIKFLETHNGKKMQGAFYENGKIKKRDQCTEEEKKEMKLYEDWLKTEERKTLEEYVGQPLENVPEEYRSKIAKLREFGLGIKEKTMYEKVIDFLESHDGRLMRSRIKDEKNGKVLKRSEMTKEEQIEINLYSNWNRSKEKWVLEEYAEQPIENVPEEYRNKIARLREYGLGKTTYKEVIDFLKSHDGKMMRRDISNEGKKLTSDEMTKEERKEVDLYSEWVKSKERKILIKYAGQSIGQVPEEYRDKIAELREFGLGKTTYEEVIDFLYNHNGKLMRPAGSNNEKNLTRTEEEKEKENKLYRKWMRSKERKILDEYAGQQIENIPEEYRNKIAKLREFGFGKTTYEEVIEFLESHNGEIMKGNWEVNGKFLKRNEITEEQKNEQNLYARWRYSKERKILNEYAGQPIENVPEEYRNKIAKLREFGLGIKPERIRTSKEIAEASISSIKDMELADQEDKILHELVEKTKEGGIQINE